MEELISFLTNEPTLAVGYIVVLGLASGMGNALGVAYYTYLKEKRREAREEEESWHSVLSKLSKTHPSRKKKG